MNKWLINWENVNHNTDLPNSVVSTLKMVDSVAFPNVSISLRLLARLPVISCECERSFSSLGQIKIWTQSKMENNRLNGTAL